jgi:pimeloyl-ACP methyl ester carboxylesterase
VRRRLIGAAAFAGAAAGSIALGVVAKRRALADVDPVEGTEWADLHRPIDGRATAVTAADGTRLHAEVLGPDDAPTIVLAHGYALSQHAWHHQRRALSGRYRVVAYDQRGHGGSEEAATGDYSMRVLGRDLAAVLAATTRPDEPVVLAGHSMGGMSILSFADQHPSTLARVAGVALVSTAGGDLLAGGAFSVGAGALSALRTRLPGLRRRPSTESRSDDPADWTTTPPTDLVFLLTRSIGLSPDADPAHVAFTEQLMTQCPRAVTAALGPALTSLRLGHVASRLAMPGVVLVGDADRLTPVGQARRLARDMPDAGLVVLPGAGHMAPLEAHEQVSAELLSLLDRVFDDGPTG